MRRFHRPHAFLQPVDQRQVISRPAKQSLTKMNVSLDETRNDGTTTRIDNHVGVLVRVAKRNDAAMRDQQVTTNDSVRRIHSDQRAVFNDDRRHRPNEHKRTLGEHKSSSPSAQLFRQTYFLSVAEAAFAFDGSTSSRTGIPNFTFTSRSIRFNTSGFSRNADLAFSRP